MELLDNVFELFFNYSHTNINNMRSQLNELVKLAKVLRSTLQINQLDDKTVQVSTWISVRTPSTKYHSVSFLNGSFALDVNLYQDDIYTNNTISINMERISDEELDEIVLRSKGDIITFIDKIDKESEQKRLSKITELQHQLSKLQKNVSAS